MIPFEEVKKKVFELGIPIDNIDCIEKIQSLKANRKNKKLGGFFLKNTPESDGSATVTLAFVDTEHTPFLFIENAYPIPGIIINLNEYFPVFIPEVKEVVEKWNNWIRSLSAV